MVTYCTNFNVGSPGNYLTVAAALDKACRRTLLKQQMAAAAGEGNGMDVGDDESDDDSSDESNDNESGTAVGNKRSRSTGSSLAAATAAPSPPPVRSADVSTA